MDSRARMALERDSISGNEGKGRELAASLGLSQPMPARAPIVRDMRRNHSVRLCYLHNLNLLLVGESSTAFHRVATMTQTKGNRAMRRNTVSQIRRQREQRIGVAMLAACAAIFSAMIWTAYTLDAARGITASASLAAWGL